MSTIIIIIYRYLRKFRYQLVSRLSRIQFKMFQNTKVGVLYFCITYHYDIFVIPYSYKLDILK